MPIWQSPGPSSHPTLPTPEASDSSRVAQVHGFLRVSPAQFSNYRKKRNSPKGEISLAWLVFLAWEGSRAFVEMPLCQDSMAPHQAAATGPGARWVWRWGTGKR